MTAELRFDFASPILRGQGVLIFHHMPVPTEIAEALMAGGTRLVIATLNGKEINRAIHSSKIGEFYLVLGMHILRDVGAMEGDIVFASLISDPNPDQVDMPEEFVATLDQDQEAADRFYAFTPGKQRSLCTYVTTAKREETRIKRSLELAHKLRTHTLAGDRLDDQ